MACQGKGQIEQTASGKIESLEWKIWHQHWRPDQKAGGTDGDENIETNAKELELKPEPGTVVALMNPYTNTSKDQYTQARQIVAIVSDDEGATETEDKEMMQTQYDIRKEEMPIIDRHKSS